MSNKIDPRFVMMDAISQAERLATNNPTEHAAIYRRHELSTGNDRFIVRLGSEEAPEGADLITTVSRKPPEFDGRFMSLADAVKHVVDNLPVGVELLDCAVIEFYPARERYGYPLDDRRVFAYQFMSTEGRNVATWIPDVSFNGVGMQPGFDGRGRPWKSGGIEGEPVERIGWMIAAAKVKDLDPGKDCTEHFAEGWHLAESSLRHGGTPHDAGPAETDAETFNGFIARMAVEQELRSRETKPAAPEARPVRRPLP